VSVKAALHAVSGAVHVPGAWRAVEAALSLAVTTGLFGAIYRFLPDARISTRDALTGALATAALFTLGTHLLSAYLAHKHAAEAFGPAGSLVMLLLWVHYSAQIFFFGAAFTAAHARLRGSGLEPAAGRGDGADVRST
jgi:membrane protein